MTPVRPETCMFLPLLYGIMLIFTFLTYHIQTYLYRVRMEDESLRPHCNGYSWLCNRRYDQVSYLTSYYSFAVGEHLLATQETDMVLQLNQGVRSLVLSPHWRDPKKKDVLDVCSRKCLFMDTGSLTDTLTKVKTFLNDNPREVLTVFFHDLGNGVTAGHVADVFRKIGIMDLAYAHPVGNAKAQWPTLQKLIDLKKRLVVFVDADVDYMQWPWMMRQNDFVWEPPRLYTNLTQMTDLTTSCVIERPKDTIRPLTLFNHYLQELKDVDEEIDYYPTTPEMALEVNSEQVLLTRIRGCMGTLNGEKGIAKERGMSVFPNFVNVMFFDRGDAMSVVNTLNAE